VSHTGARLVLCDAEPDSGSINVAAVASAITPATRVIIPVHLFGHPADIDALVEIARDRGIRILEDAAHAHGATYKGRRCGGLADAAAFSFYPTKNLGALGDAGCVTTDDAELAGRLRSLRDRGAASRDLYLELGYNSRLDAVQAAILRWKLERVDEWNRRRNDLARFYLFELSGVHGVVLPAIRSWAKPVWHAFAILVPGSIRDEVQQALLEDGIETNVHYRLPIHLQPCYSDRGWQRGDYPVSERRADESLSLPLDPFHTENEVARVVASLRNALNRLRVAG
jgi:dTDP-3-amino-3,4,6-trideoxy-alpha-D-glucose transaminase